MAKRDKSIKDYILGIASMLAGDKPLVSPIPKDKVTQEGGTYKVEFNKEPIGKNLPVPTSTPMPTTNTPMRDFPKGAFGEGRSATVIEPTVPTVVPKPQTKESGDLSEYWNRIKEKGVEIAKRYDLPASVLLSQAALESGRGKSNFARERNNLVGFTAYTSNPDAATTFKKPEDSLEAWAELMTKDPRYKQALKERKNPYQFIIELKKAGYATDPDYVEKVTSMPEFREHLDEAYLRKGKKS